MNETVGEPDLADIVAAFGEVGGRMPRLDQEPPTACLPAPFARTSPFLTHPVFNTHHSETEMMRYIRRLERRDLGLDTAMIPLGSCTMKLNAAAEMMPVSWPEFARMHPFAPVDQAGGYRQIFEELEAGARHHHGARPVFAAAKLRRAGRARWPARHRGVSGLTRRASARTWR